MLLVLQIAQYEAVALEVKKLLLVLFWTVFRIMRFGCQFVFFWALQTIWRVVWGNKMSSRVGHNKPGVHLG